MSTRWYRAPEILLSAPSYSTGVDVWAAGCMMGELLTSLPLFPGTSHADQLHRVVNAVGAPKAGEWQEGAALAAAAGLASSAVLRPAGASSIVAAARGLSAPAAAALDAMLTLTPSRRPTAAAVLAMPFFAAPDVASEVAALADAIARCGKGGDGADAALARADAEAAQRGIDAALAAEASGAAPAPPAAAASTPSAVGSSSTSPAAAEVDSDEEFLASLAKKGGRGGAAAAAGGSGAAGLALPSLRSGAPTATPAAVTAATVKVAARSSKECDTDDEAPAAVPARAPAPATAKAATSSKEADDSDDGSGKGCDTDEDDADAALAALMETGFGFGRGAGAGGLPLRR